MAEPGDSAGGLGPFGRACAMEELPGGALPGEAGAGLRFRATLTAAWAQGRAGFGGLMAAWALGAAERAAGVGAGSGAGSGGTEPGATRALRGITAQFFEPIAPGEVEVRGEVVRAGRSLTQARGEVWQGGRRRMELVAAFGAARATALSGGAGGGPGEGPQGHEQRQQRKQREAARAGRWAEVPEVPEGAMPQRPAFTQNFRYRWAAGVPYSGGAEARIEGWIALRGGDRAGAAAILAMVDAWPMPGLVLLDRPAPASTASWMLNIVGDITGGDSSGGDSSGGDIPVSGWWYFVGEMVAADGGWADAEGRLYAADGRLVAVSRQLVAEFSERAGARAG